MIKLLALDMDGTLLNEDQGNPTSSHYCYSPSYRKGVKLVLCTGRPTFRCPPPTIKTGT